MKMMSITNKPALYWGVQAALIGPLIVLWCGVAYWFGFATEVILKTVFPRSLAPIAFFGLMITALVFTLWHRSRIPRRERSARRTDTAICVFIAFSMMLVLGQFMAFLNK